MRCRFIGGAEIGTSKPTDAERVEVPHGGLDLVDFGAAFDVAQYLKHAEAFFAGSRARAGRAGADCGWDGALFSGADAGDCARRRRGRRALRGELASRTVGGVAGAAGDGGSGDVGGGLTGANPRRLARAIEVVGVDGEVAGGVAGGDAGGVGEGFPGGVDPAVRRRSWEARIAARVEGDVCGGGGWRRSAGGLVERFGVEAVRGFGGIGYGEIAEGLGGNGTYGTDGTYGTGEEGRELKRNIMVATAAVCEASVDLVRAGA